MKTIHFGELIVLAVTLLVAPTASAQADYPNKALRMGLPYTPGGGSDVLCRSVGQKLSGVLGQQVIVDNRPGGGANIGAQIVAKARPDGYTLLLVSVAHAINVTYYRTISYDLIKDFAPVSLLAETPHVLVVHPSMPVNSVKELIALATARPGKLDYSSAGAGSSPHMAGALFLYMAGVRMTHIPYSGGGPATMALLGGQVQVGFPTTPSALPQVKAGKLRGLAVTTGKRSPSIPELPTIGEAGVPGYEMSTWYGFLATAGTPKEVVARLHAEMVKLLKLPDVEERLDSGGFEPIGTTPEQFAAYIRSEVDKWAKVIKALDMYAGAD